MNRSPWLDLLNRVPETDYDKLLISMINGVEISVQSVIQIEQEYMIVLGRLTGTTDAGMCFFVPLTQINYLSFQRPMRESEVREMLSLPEASARRAESVSDQLPSRDRQGADSAASARRAESGQRPASEPQPPGSGFRSTPQAVEEKDEPPRNSPAAKAALLEKLRARRSAG